MDYTLDITLKNHEILTGYLENLALEELNAIPTDLTIIFFGTLRTRWHISKCICILLQARPP
ncbi:hypothetical protein [Flavimarina sp. Hel_I_48]|uniref:hypothetical protein n=1 Tax=Flavimarina sp. Hel_I_48 TaxID=1392488 RepID=UPI0013D9BC0F|nr:hypothetical protein [Flavimarina sp. Hel_I_48]